MESTKAQTKNNNSFSIRDELKSIVLKELLGPFNGENEEIPDISPKQKYILGCIAPKNLPIILEQIEKVSTDVEDNLDDGNKDEESISSPSMFPSSIGLSFSLVPEAKEIVVTAQWGAYQKEESETFVTETGKPKLVWQRKAHTFSFLLDAEKFPTGQIGPIYYNKEQPIYFQGLIRKDKDAQHVSLFLVNGQQEPTINKDVAWLFQPEIILESKGVSYSFISRNTDRRNIDLEEMSMDMLYRKTKEFAVGHNIGVQVEGIHPNNPNIAKKISTRVVPEYEVPQTVSTTIEDNPNLKGIILDMKLLSELPKEELIQNLNILPEAYEIWIQEQASKLNKADELLEPYREAVKTSLAHCAITKERIREGIQLLQKDPMVLEAFQFANKAVYWQRVRSVYIRALLKDKKSKIEDFDIEKNRSWRLFQLGFILLNLPSIAILNHKERSHPTEAVADLLWFPTGGGKTEAYLGLTAFTICIRRLQGVIEGRNGEFGIAVLMRYTLRLLTLQQFQRATALICACELLRKQYVSQGKTEYGSTPFRIGLWVGQKNTPNNFDQSKGAVRDIKEGKNSTVGSPLQNSNCPWCGAELTINQLKLDEAREQTLLYCSDSSGKCNFSEKNSPGVGVPVVVVDDEIYRLLPSLVIATVDKFAQMAWNGQTSSLFGKVNKHCSEHGFFTPESEHSNSHPSQKGTVTEHSYLRPPDLIIQDELHLISGPLGTLVGLYETAVDELCSWYVNGSKVKPKIVASTATIKQASSQIENLFMRKLAIFPPQGVDIQDNFFSIQRPTEDGKFPGRKYVGICAPGQKVKSILIRLYSSILLASLKLYNREKEKADPYMTLVGYFNSIRELGGTKRLVDDDISSYLKIAVDDSEKRILHKTVELTSRIGQDKIKKTLRDLEDTFSDSSKKAIDILLATNMISVGVDIDRLGVMVINGQPKTTSEYIQASSRVGRSFPGIVFTIYNWSKPRDISHYERFENYHSCFYKYVETLSVTPFSEGATRRGLTGTLVSLARLSIPELNKNSSANMMKPDHEYIQEIIEIISFRAGQLTDPETKEAIREALLKRIQKWDLKIKNEKKSGSDLAYDKEKKYANLLTHPGISKWETFHCLDSLREVEKTALLFLFDDTQEEGE